jgi:DNA-binding CsgD family transcriptional regulator
MTTSPLGLAQRVVRRPAHVLAPVAAALFLAAAIIGEAGRGPWPDLLLFLIPLAVMIGIAPFLPVVALTLMILVPVSQLAGWVVDATANSWPSYLAIPITAFLLALSAEGWSRRAVLPVGVVAVTVVAYLIAVPQRDEGGWSEWTGWGMLIGIERVHPRQDDFIGLSLTGLGLYLGGWGLGLLCRSAVQGRFDGLVRLLSVAPPRQDDLLATPSSLTSREGDIYRLVAEGLSNAEIATHEHISETTVKSHVRAILRKLELRSRSQIVAHAHGRPGRATEGLA